MRIQKPTHLFFQANPLLICNVINMLDAIKSALIKACNNTKVPNIVCMAAHMHMHASLLLLQKYHLLMDSCEIYCIAISR